VLTLVIRIGIFTFIEISPLHQQGAGGGQAPWASTFSAGEELRHIVGLTEISFQSFSEFPMI
jgi:hypothetical protein